MEYIFKIVEKHKDFSLLKDKKGDTIKLSSNKLPQELIQDSDVFINITSNSLKDESAKSILNEILKTE